MSKIYIANQAVNEFTYAFLINKELWKLAVVFFIIIITIQQVPNV